MGSAFSQSWRPGAPEARREKQGRAQTSTKTLVKVVWELLLGGGWRSVPRVEVLLSLRSEERADGGVNGSLLFPCDLRQRMGSPVWPAVLGVLSCPVGG